MRKFTLPSLLVLVLLVPAPAAEFHIDPEHGKPDNDGSPGKPWRSLQEVVARGLIQTRKWESLPHKADSKLVAANEGARIKGGDTIWLHDGDHGRFSTRGCYNAGFVTIAAAEGQTPRLHGIDLKGGSHWVFRGLHLSPDPAAGGKAGTLVGLRSHGFHGPIHDCVIEDCSIESIDDSSDWSAKDWNEFACGGIIADGTKMVIRRNRLKNVSFGITLGASHSIVEHNTVENFCGDGLRGLGDHSVFQHNLVKNCYDVNDNHDDGFQSWSSADGKVGRGEVKGIVLRGNTIINYEDPDQPHRGALQGIGCFDGMYVDWVVENNVVVVDHYHGITLMGARGCRIINNTVIDPNNNRPGPAAIRISKHKNGTPPSGCTIRNNLTSSLSIHEGESMTEDHNLVVEDRAQVFVDPTGLDLRLRQGSPAIDAGSPEFAPKTDIAGKARPQGGGVDIGAHEFVPAIR